MTLVEKLKLANPETPNWKGFACVAYSARWSDGRYKWGWMVVLDLGACYVRLSEDCGPVVTRSLEKVLEI